MKKLLLLIFLAVAAPVSASINTQLKTVRKDLKERTKKDKYFMGRLEGVNKRLKKLEKRTYGSRKLSVIAQAYDDMDDEDEDE